MWYATVESWSKGVTSSSGFLSSSSKNPVIVTPQNTLSRMKKFIIISTIVIHSSKNLLITHSTRFETTCYVHKTARHKYGLEEAQGLARKTEKSLTLHKLQSVRHTGELLEALGVLSNFLSGSVNDRWDGTLVQQPLVTFY